MAEKEFDANFIQAFLKGLKNDAIKSVIDITNLYEACIPQGYPLNQSDIARALKRTIILLYSSFDEEPERGDQIRKWIEYISECIKKLEEILPYADLPDAERGIPNDIINYSENDNKLAIKQKISELSKIISIKENELSKAKKESDRSHRWAVISATLTIAFGVLGVAFIILLNIFSITKNNRIF